MATSNISQNLQELYFDTYSGISEHIIDVMEMLQEWDSRMPVITLETSDSAIDYLHVQAEDETFKILLIKHIEKSLQECNYK